MKVIKVASKSNTSRVAGSIAHAVRADGRTHVQCIGASAVNQMMKAIIVAKRFLAEEDIMLTFSPEFVDVTENGLVRTAVRVTVFTNHYWNVADHEAQKNRPAVESRDEAVSGQNDLTQKIEVHHAESPRLAGGDVDAAWDQANVGAETVGGHAPTPDQDRVDALGEAVGLTYADDEPLRSEEKLAERDQHRWELNSSSASNEL